MDEFGSANGSRTRWLADLAGPFQSKWRVFSAGCMAELAKHPHKWLWCWTRAGRTPGRTAPKTAKQRRTDGARRVEGVMVAVRGQEAAGGARVAS